MSHIRSVKPEFYQHEELFEAERRTGLPLRLAYSALWTLADREGRFKWRPRALKLGALPYDDVDMDSVLLALCACTSLVKYEVNGEVYGCITAWKRHQVVNAREAASHLPPPPEKQPNQSLDACTTTHSQQPVRAQVMHRMEGRGEGREGEGNTRASTCTGQPTPLNGKAENPNPPSHGWDTPEDLPAIQLARGMIEQLGAPFSHQLMIEISNSIEAKVRAGGMTYAEAHDYIRDKARKNPPPHHKWRFYFDDSGYEGRAKAKPTHGWGLTGGGEDRVIGKDGKEKPRG